MQTVCQAMINLQISAKTFNKRYNFYINIRQSLKTRFRKSRSCNLKVLVSVLISDFCVSGTGQHNQVMWLKSTSVVNMVLIFK